MKPKERNQSMAVILKTARRNRFFIYFFLFFIVATITHASNEYTQTTLYFFNVTVPVITVTNYTNETGGDGGGCQELGGFCEYNSSCCSDICYHNECVDYLINETVPYVYPNLTFEQALNLFFTNPKAFLDEYHILDKISDALRNTLEYTEKAIKWTIELSNKVINFDSSNIMPWLSDVFSKMEIYLNKIFKVADTLSVKYGLNAQIFMIIFAIIVFLVAHKQKISYYLVGFILFLAFFNDLNDYVAKLGKILLPLYPLTGFVLMLLGFVIIGLLSQYILKRIRRSREHNYF